MRLQSGACPQHFFLRPWAFQVNALSKQCSKATLFDARYLDLRRRRKGLILVFLYVPSCRFTTQTAVNWCIARKIRRPRQAQGGARQGREIVNNNNTNNTSSNSSISNSNSNNSNNSNSRMHQPCPNHGTCLRSLSRLSTPGLLFNDFADFSALPTLGTAKKDLIVPH